MLPPKVPSSHEKSSGALGTLLAPSAESASIAADPSVALWAGCMFVIGSSPFVRAPRAGSHCANPRPSKDLDGSAVTVPAKKLVPGVGGKIRTDKTGILQAADSRIREADRRKRVVARSAEGLRKYYWQDV